MISTSVIWIIFPGISAAVLVFISRWKRISNLLGILITGMLTVLALTLPIGELNPIRLSDGLPLLRVTESMGILGRNLILDSSSRLLLFIIYGTSCFWFVGSTISGSPRYFIPLGLAIAASSTAALAVEPYLYAALLIEAAVLLSIPILNPPSTQSGPGILRFLVYQTIGMCFILFTGWALAGTGTDTTDRSSFILTLILLGLGFTFLAGLFPFHSWIPMLAEESHPYPAAYILFFIPLIVSLFASLLFQRIPWLLDIDTVSSVMRAVGGVMVFFGGIWAIFQKTMSRIFGFAVIHEIGLMIISVSFISLSSTQPESSPLPFLPTNFVHLELFYISIISRAFSLGVWALALHIIKSHRNTLHLKDVEGLARELPFASASVVIATLSVSGFPLLAAFPVRVAVWLELSRISLPVLLLTLIGSTGLIVASVRTLGVLARARVETHWIITETWSEILLLVLGWGMLVLVGLLV